MANEYRVSSVSTEVLHNAPGAARVSSLVAEALHNAPGAARVSNTAVELLRSISYSSTYPAELSLINPGFETGDATGWSIVHGTLPVASTTTKNYSGVRSGNPGSDFGSSTYPWHGQVVDIPGTYLADVDAGLLEATLSLFQMIDSSIDYCAPVIEFFDATAGGGTRIGVVLMSWSNSPVGSWIRRSQTNWVPQGTRSIRVGFISLRGFGDTPIDVYVDDFSLVLTDRASPHERVFFNRGDDNSGFTFTTGSSLTPSTAGAGSLQVTPWLTWPWYGLVAPAQSAFAVYRDYSLASGHHAGIDAGDGRLEFTGQTGTVQNMTDRVRVAIEALDASNASLGVVAENASTAAATNFWTTPFSIVASIPVGTRKLRYHYRGERNTTFWPDAHAYAHWISAQIESGASVGGGGGTILRRRLFVNN